MISTWIKDHASQCNKCGSKEVIFYKKFNAKIDRYAVACKGCGAFFGWLPNILMPEIPAENIISEGERQVLKWRHE